MMKANRIIAGLLVLIGFGSCCNRPSKSRVSQANTVGTSVTVEDTVRPITFAYAMKRTNFDVAKSIYQAPADSIPAPKVGKIEWEEQK